MCVEERAARRGMEGPRITQMTADDFGANVRLTFEGGNRGSRGSTRIRQRRSFFFRASARLFMEKIYAACVHFQILQRGSTRSRRARSYREEVDRRIADRGRWSVKKEGRPRPVFIKINGGTDWVLDCLGLYRGSTESRL
jgi:hypothetical protein